MGWKGALRSYQASVRREVREERRRLRELIQEEKEAQRKTELQLAEQAVARFEITIAILTSVHRECGPNINWNAIATATPPTPPEPVTAKTVQAQHALEAYHPSIFARIFGTATKRRAALAAAVEAARAYDALDTETARQQHVQACEETEAARELAGRVLKGDAASYRLALDELDVFEELRGVGANVSIDTPSADVVKVDLLVQERQVVPSNQETLTARGKLSSKKMPNTRGNEIYQDYVCGAALRACREVFAALPVNWAIATVRTEVLDPATGHTPVVPVVSIIAPRRTIERLNFAALDPSDALTSFTCRMKFKKGSGMAPVEDFRASEIPRDT